MTTASKSRWVPNPAFANELIKTEFLRTPLTDTMEKLEASCKSTAPVDKGDFRDSIEGVVGMTVSGITGRLNVWDWKAAFIEFGTSEYPFDRPINRGIEAAGMRLSEVKK